MYLRTTLVLFAALVLAPCAGAQPGGHAHPAASAAAKDVAMAEVRNVDKAAGRITLKHGELKALGMSPMTMVFDVRDKRLLDKVKIGDKVRFAAEKTGDALVVTAIEPAN